ncbi:MAG: hypothetical protein HY928_14665 [Elusimicrobia bacterium]|nr:hypothetical protein [Elusimicrobiota bacterium]
MDVLEPRPVGIWWAVPQKEGLLIGDLDQEGAGWKAGLRPGDLLTAVHGKAVSSQEDFFRLRGEFQGLKSGDRRIFSVTRAGTGKAEEMDVAVELVRQWKPVRRN